MMTEHQTSDSLPISTVQRDAKEVKTTGAHTILVVEDDPGTLDVVSLVLRGGGYQVLQASGGEPALSVLKMIRPDLIISDIMMYDMDGFSLYKHVRANPETTQIPFIFLTAMAQRTDIRRGMELGADDYLTKPFEPEDLLSAVETRLARAAETNAAFNQASANLKNTIVQVVTHELRTPLTLMFGYTELLKATGPGLGEEDLQEILRGLYSGTRRLMELVEDMLLLSRIESGVLAKEIQEFPGPTEDPDLVVGAVVEQFECQAANRNVSIAIHPRVPTGTAAIREKHLTEIVRQLVDNAIKFSKPSGGRAILTTRLNEEYWVLEIVDNGVGIRKDALPWVFEAFRQADRDKMEQQGAGLGLAIVKGLTEAYGGSVAVESRLGLGSRFTVHLPLAN